MGEDSKPVKPMIPLGNLAKELVEFAGMVDPEMDENDPCPDCNGTGTFLFEHNGQTVSRPCRHF
jgi:hypothetical protein